MTHEPDTLAPVPVSWGERSLARLSRVDELRIPQAIATVETLEAPEWTRTLKGTLAYAAAAASFLVLTVLVKHVPGPGWMLIAPVYVILAALVFWVALPRRSDG